MARVRSRSPRSTAGSSGDVCLGTAKFEFDSDHALYLVKQWAWGRKSACAVRLEAEFAMKDQEALLGAT